MCPTCPCNSSSIPGAGEVVGGVAVAAVGAAVDVAISKPGRKVLFWGLCVPALPFAIWGELHWWTLALVAVLAVATGVGVAYMKVMGRHVLIQAPASLRAALPAPRRAVALPRGLSVTRGRRALPAPAKALPAAVVTGRVVPAPVRGKVVR
jgi:hypothetical protein